MSLLLAPYNTAMRIGQGFNSYTQQICVDDAVLIDPERPENILTNDGTTMRIAVETAGKPSAWSRIKEVISEGSVVSQALLEASDSIAAAATVAAPEDSTVSGATTSEVSKDVSVKDDSVDASVEEPASSTAEDTVVAQSESEDSEANGNDTGTNSSVDKEEREEVVSTTKKGPVKSVDEDGTTKKKEDVIDAGKVTKPAPPKAVPTNDAPGAGSAAKPALPTSKAIDSKGRLRASSVGTKQSTLQVGTENKSGSSKSQFSGVPTRTSHDPAVALTTNNSSKATAKRLPSDIEIEQARLDRAEKLEMMTQEKNRMAERRAYQQKLELQAREDAQERQAEDRREQIQIRKEKRDYDAARRQAAQVAIKEAVAAKKTALTLEDLNKIKAQNQFADRFDGMINNDEKYTFDASGAKGPSQSVAYSSRFIDKLSDVTEDMQISGALSVKMAKIGGSGRGSFVDSDKFKQSDLNFYVSVKVVNQTTNFKDALVYNKLRSVDIGSDKFNKVYGDSFISGFQEGGEFNAIISMKVHNKAKLLDIQAEAKVALTAGPVDITAEANVGIARTNLEMNTETTIQVSWCGGGNIKPMEQQWNIQSVMQAAARFPTLVADCPQRTHAILTKYESLRSFVSLLPAGYSPLQYENAQIYTSVLMDAFMSYKSLYKSLGDQGYSIQNKTLEIEPWSSGLTDQEYTAPVKSAVALYKPTVTSPTTTSASAAAAAIDTSRFAASLRGLSDARKVIRRQMVYIVNEVDLIEKDPKVATDEEHEEPFQSPSLFETRLPATKIPDALKPKSDPLTGTRIMAKTQTEADFEKEQAEQVRLEGEDVSLYRGDQILPPEEMESFSGIQKKVRSIGKHFQVSAAVPDLDQNRKPVAKADEVSETDPKEATKPPVSKADQAKADQAKAEKVKADEAKAKQIKENQGVFFNNLDFLATDWQVESITIGITHRGCVGSVEVVYENGLLLRKGLRPENLLVLKTLANFQPGERITSAAIEVGAPVLAPDSEAELEPRVLSVCLYTNHGRRLLGQAASNEILPGTRGRVRKDGTVYEQVTSHYFDSAYSTGDFKGFFGRIAMSEATGGIIRLGLIWGDSTSKMTRVTVVDNVSIHDSETAASVAVINRLTQERDKARTDTKEALDQAKKDVAKEVNEITTLHATMNFLEKERYELYRDIGEIKKQAIVDAGEQVAEAIKNNKMIQLAEGLPTGRQSVSFSPDKFRVNASSAPFLRFENGVKFVFQPDGNLKVFGSANQDLYNRKQFRAGATVLWFQSDGNLVAYGPVGPPKDVIWATATEEKCRDGRIVFSSEAPYLELFKKDGSLVIGYS